jgi:hypothetical protein
MHLTFNFRIIKQNYLMVHFLSVPNSEIIVLHALKWRIQHYTKLSVSPTPSVQLIYPLVEKVKKLLFAAIRWH